MSRVFAVPATNASLADRLAQRTLELCQIPSPIGQERELADYLERWAKQQFTPAQVLRHSHSLVVGARTDPRPTVALIGHVDTVPPHPADGSPRIEEERVFGLGSSDMKSGLAVMMQL